MLPVRARTATISVPPAPIDSEARALKRRRLADALRGEKRPTSLGEAAPAPAPASGGSLRCARVSRAAGECRILAACVCPTRRGRRAAYAQQREG